MAQVELKNVDKSFGQTKVIKDVHLSIEKGEFVVFVGLQHQTKSCVCLQ